MPGSRALPLPNDWDRTAGAPGARREEERGRIRGRRPPAEVVEVLEFPEAVGNELTLRRALASLAEKAVNRPERADRFVRKVALSARLVGGASWRRTLTFRDPAGDHDRIRIALGPKIAGCRRRSGRFASSSSS